MMDEKKSEKTCIEIEMDDAERIYEIIRKQIEREPSLHEIRWQIQLYDRLAEKLGKEKE